MIWVVDLDGGFDRWVAQTREVNPRCACNRSGSVCLLVTNMVGHWVTQWWSLPWILERCMRFLTNTEIVS